MKYAKAIAAAISAALAATSAAYVQGNGHISLIAGVIIAGAAVHALLVVWGVANAPYEPANPAQPPA